MSLFSRKNVPELIGEPEKYFFKAGRVLVPDSDGKGKYVSAYILKVEIQQTTRGWHWGAYRGLMSESNPTNRDFGNIAEGYVRSRRGAFRRAGYEASEAAEADGHSLLGLLIRHGDKSDLAPEWAKQDESKFLGSDFEIPGRHLDESGKPDLSDVDSSAAIESPAADKLELE